MNNNLSLISDSARSGADFLKKGIVRLFLSAIFCGIIAAAGVLLSAVICAPLDGTDFQAFASVFAGSSFAASLALILILDFKFFSQSLFCGIVGKINHVINIAELILTLIITLIGNLVGIIISSFVAMGTGVLDSETGYFLVNFASENLASGFVSTLLKSLASGIILTFILFIFYKSEHKITKLFLVLFAGLFGFTLCRDLTFINIPTYIMSMLSPFNGGLISGGLAFTKILTTVLGNLIGIIAASFAILFIFSDKKDVPLATAEAITEDVQNEDELF